MLTTSSILFVERPVPADASYARAFAYTDPVTERTFALRVEHSGRVLLCECRPAPRLVQFGVGDRVDDYARIPPTEWEAARAMPSALYALVRRLERETGYARLLLDDGYSPDSLYYASVDDAADATARALTEDRWYRSVASACA